MSHTKLLQSLDINPKESGVSTGSKWFGDGNTIASHSPIDGSFLAEVTTASVTDFERVVETAESAFAEWRKVPAPKRGEIIRQFGDKLRENKEALGQLVSL